LEKRLQRKNERDEIGERKKGYRSKKRLRENERDEMGERF
jgi:hypothetical protein